jgi:hypothetical protein
MWSQHTASQVQMLVGIAREKIVFKAQMVRIGDTITIARTKSPKRMMEDVFIVRSIKGLYRNGNTTSA